MLTELHHHIQNLSIRHTDQRAFSGPEVRPINTPPASSAVIHVGVPRAVVVCTGGGDREEGRGGEGIPQHDRAQPGKANYMKRSGVYRNGTQRSQNRIQTEIQQKSAKAGQEEAKRNAHKKKRNIEVEAGTLCIK